MIEQRKERMGEESERRRKEEGTCKVEQEVKSF